VFRVDFAHLRGWPSDKKFLTLQTSHIFFLTNGSVNFNPDACIVLKTPK